MDTETTIFLAEAPKPIAPRPRRPTSRRTPGNTRAVSPSQHAYAKKRRFLDAYVQLGTLRAAALSLKMHPSVISRWQARDPLFKAEVEDARETITQQAESAIYTRGLEKSDGLLLAFVRRHRPEWRDARGTVDVTIDQRQQVAVQRTEFHVNSLSDQDLATLEQSVAQLLEKARLAAAGNTKPTLALEGEGKK